MEVLKLIANEKELEIPLELNEFQSRSIGAFALFLSVSILVAQNVQPHLPTLQVDEFKDLVATVLPQDSANDAVPLEIYTHFQKYKHSISIRYDSHTQRIVIESKGGGSVISAHQFDTLLNTIDEETGFVVMIPIELIQAYEKAAEGDPDLTLNLFLLNRLLKDGGLEVVITPKS